MHENQSKLLGLNDELAMFIAQMNVFRGKGVADSHELTVFLQLYGSQLLIRGCGKQVNFNLPSTQQCLVKPTLR